MIMAKAKPIEEIINDVRNCKKILLIGCNGCVAVCEAGGLKEVQVLAAALRMYFVRNRQRMVIDEISLTRQCDREYLREIKDRVENYDALVSLACGAGVQFLAEMYEEKPVYPAVDTCFIGVTLEQGVWSERCQACGQCVLSTTGGICPIARCSKRMLNGPCGGSENGKCEISVVLGRDIPCGWHLIYERLKILGHLDRFGVPSNDKDWTASRDGGPRDIVREDVRP
ncbi:MAG: methylenetetrahydrofolate reductase C-terminal domain-containing protein [Syntrophobacteraceae bacterium]|nr:methylenetetrahydrofolate reductase C-terminal domain-containing protein [Desulfobacteraceae bacterium]